MRVETVGNATLYLGDCFDVVPTLDAVDAVVTDPPYGDVWTPRLNHRNAPWKDDTRPDIRPLLIGKSHCVWGGNYFADQLPVSEAWLIWLKRPAGFDDDPRTYAPCEIAWTDFGGKPRIKTHVWDGGKRAGAKDNRSFCHPAQKPVEVMDWCVSLTDAETILDPFMGSGTTGMACANLGRRFVGIELQPEYFDLALNRIRAAQAQVRLFA